MKLLLTIIIGFSLVLTSLSRPASETTAEADLITRSYKISPEAFVHGLKQLTRPKTGEKNQELLLRFLKENKMEIQKPAGVFLDETKGRLLVRISQADVDKMEALVQKITNIR